MRTPRRFLQVRRSIIREAAVSPDPAAAVAVAVAASRYGLEGGDASRGGGWGKAIHVCGG